MEGSASSLLVFMVEMIVRSRDLHMHPILSPDSLAQAFEVACYLCSAATAVLSYLVAWRL